MQFYYTELRTIIIVCNTNFSVSLSFREGIRCNTIVPGNIDTPMSQTVDVEYPQFVDKLLDTLAMHRKGKPSGKLANTLLA